MKKKISIAVCVMLLSLSTSAYSATDTLYLSANLGVGFFSDAEVTGSDASAANYDIEANTGYGLGAAVGYEFDNTRIESEFVYHNNTLDQATTAGGDAALSDDIDSFAVLINGYRDFANDSRWTPFLGGGLGLAMINVDDDTAYLGDDSATVFAFQISTGIAYAVNEVITVDCRYRYFATTNPEFDSGETEYRTHNVYAGVRYSF